MIVIRSATIDAADYLPAIERSAAEAFRTLPMLAFLANGEVKSAAWHKRLIAAGTCWVASLPQAGLVGFISAEVVDRDIHVWELSVASSHQGLGIGRLLMAAVIESASARGLATVTLTTFREVPWNAPFYERFGFAVLSQEVADDRLGRILAEESTHGLDGTTRCAMRLNLSPLA